METQQVKEDSAIWQGETLVYSSFNEYRKPEEQSRVERFTKVDPFSESFCYWCAVDGQCFALGGQVGQSCIATIENALMLGANPSKAFRMDRVYVIWQPKNHTPAVWKRWQTKWSKRTSI